MKSRLESKEEALNEGTEIAPREIKIKEFESDGIRYHIEDFEDRIRTQYPNLDSSAVKKFVESYLDDLDKGTDYDNLRNKYGEGLNTHNLNEYSEEELKEIWDKDSGYVNGKVMKKLPSTHEMSEDSNYKELISEDYLRDGLHKDVIDYGPESVPGTEEKVTLQPGTVLIRWGKESGKFAAPEGTRYDELEMPVSEDKLEKNTYVVLRPLGGPESELVVKSKVAIQNWNNNTEASTDRTSEDFWSGGIQFKFQKSIKTLIQEGYITWIDNKEGGFK